MKKKKSEIELICIEKILNYKQTITLGPNLISSINPNLYNLIASVLIAENNPDDFLDLEGVFTEEVIAEERRNFSEVQGVFSAEEELEEGEILE